MILAAGLMVLVGVGLFVGGVLTGTDTLYWACVVACLVAAGLLLAARRQLGPVGTATHGPTSGAPATSASGTTPAGGSPVTASGASPVGTVADRTEDGSTSPAEGIRRSRAAALDLPVDLPDPPAEEVEVTDLLLVMDLTDEVLVVDEHPRYHLAGCVHLRGRTPIPLPMDEARTDGFTPCAVCAPDRTLAERVRARKAAGNG